MLCAVCLYQGEPEDAVPAITIANGQAICSLHFYRTRHLIAPDYSVIALAGLNNPVVLHGSGPGQSS